MLISPPFLPQHAASSPDDPWLALAMNGGGFGDGAFPLGADLAWHGGVHLTAPSDGGKRLPVRAMADGTVAYVRPPKPQTSNASDPLNYGGGWSDNGCVVIRHETEIGEGITVRYFSIILHLKRIAADVKQGQKIWRKDEIGEAGSVYGKTARVHVEIVCDDTNLAALVGRASGALDTSKNGRTTSLFGNAYLRLPAGTPFYDAIPLPPEHVGFWPETTALPKPAWSSTDALVVGIDLARPHGTQYVTCAMDGKTIGSVPATTDTALFDTACALAKRTQGGVGRDAYELLRFGRVLDPLGNADGLQNWQQVAYPGGQGWVNLHAMGVHAFSDADFPDWCGWQLVDDDTDSDSRCDSATLIDLILQTQGGATAARCAQALGKVSGSDVQARLARTICKFPTEWEKATVTTRWQWLTKETPPGAGSMAGPYLKPEDFPRFKAHSEALCFWEEANLGIPSKHWHFHPREFVRVFRQCGWLSKDEMIQLFPKTAMREAAHHQWVSEPITVLPRTVAGYHNELNKACRRYGIVTPLRMAAFYANAMVETQWFARLEEQVNSAHPPRYYPWNGRGFMQLTWPDNYIKYWLFIGRDVDDDLASRLKAAHKEVERRHKHHLPNENEPLAALEATVAAAHMKPWRTETGDGTRIDISADTAGTFWAWNGFARNADTEPVNQRASKPATGTGSHMYYSSPGMRSVAVTINGGGNGLVARFQAYNTCEVVLLDTPAFPGSNKPNEPQDYKPRHS